MFCNLSKNTGMCHVMIREQWLKLGSKGGNWTEAIWWYLQAATRPVMGLTMVLTCSLRQHFSLIWIVWNVLNYKQPLFFQSEKKWLCKNGDKAKGQKLWLCWESLIFPRLTSPHLVPIFAQSFFMLYGVELVWEQHEEWQAITCSNPLTILSHLPFFS